mgnify:CR=1 FL=1
MSEILNFLNLHWSIISFFIYLISIILILYVNPFNIIAEHSEIVIFFIITIGLFNLLLWRYFIGKDSDSKLHTINFIYKIFTSTFALLLIFALMFFICYYIFFTPFTLSSIIVILNISIVIGLLAIGYKYFKVNPIEPSKIKSILELLKHLVFYLPCLVIDLVEYLKNQYKITTKTVWILLLIEISIILLRFSIPQIYKIFTYNYGKLIKQGPLYLNVENDLGIFQNYKKNQDKNNKKNTLFNYNFALSFWIWINPQPESTSQAYNKSTTLLNYGDVIQINFNKNKIEILAQTSNDSVSESNKLIKVYETKDILYQRWNNFVLNYSGGTLDIFINDILVVSQINITPIMYANKVTSGSNNGINGGIKNIVYYDNVLSRNYIHSIYNYF